jgi:hypothetical protein
MKHADYKLLRETLDANCGCRSGNQRADEAVARLECLHDSVKCPMCRREEPYRLLA